MPPVTKPSPKSVEELLAVAAPALDTVLKDPPLTIAFVQVFVETLNVATVSLSAIIHPGQQKTLEKYMTCHAKFGAEKCRGLY